MITYIRGDIFTSPATVLVNTVNTAGVMGKGIAKDFKAYFPEMFRNYQEACETGELRIGTLQFFRTPHKSVLNFPTKRHWRQKSRVEDIERGLQTFVARYSDFSISSVAFPQLGCGNGELDWETHVRPLMEKYLSPLPIDVYIHLYDAGTSFIEHRNPDEMKRWLRSEPESLPFTEFWDDVQNLVTRATNEHPGENWTIETVESGEDEVAIVFGDGMDRDVQTTTDLRQVWQQLRSFGLVSDEDLGSASSVGSRAFLRLLTGLDYIETTSFVTIRNGDLDFEMDDAHGFVAGIRLIPRPSLEPRTNQLELIGIS